MKTAEIGRELDAMAMGRSMRLGQLLCNVMTTKMQASSGDALQELFYTPVEALLKAVKSYLRSKQHDGSSTT